MDNVMVMSKDIATPGVAVQPAEPQPARLVSEELVRKAKNGDPQAREALARALRQPAYGLALQLLRRREEALDVAQESLLRFFVNIHRIDPARPVLPWLRRIVRNRAIDVQRRKKVRRADSIDSDGPEGGNIEVFDPKADVAGGVVDRDLRELLWTCVGRLAPEHREIVVLRDYQDLAYKEIAAILEIPMGTVMSRLHRARAELRKLVAAEQKARVESRE